MAVLKLCYSPDPVLRKKAKRVRAIDSSLRKLVGDMVETMHACSGVGLAAPQIGVSLRIIVIGGPEQPEIVIVNPEMVRKKGERVVHEGCLSIPGYFAEIKRAESVVVKGQDLEGKGLRIRAEGLLSHALEHEIDHLNGVLYVDYLEKPEDLREVEEEPDEPVEPLA